MEINQISNLEEQLAELRRRLFRLENALARHGIALSEPAAPEPAAPKFVAPALEGQPALASDALPHQAAAEFHPEPQPFPTATPLFHAFASEAASDNRTLENRIASHWFNRIGILAMLIGMAWFLKLAMDNHWIGPLGRVLIGLVAGVGFIVWSEHFRSRGYAGFSYSLKAVGSGTLYLSLWAAFSLYQLIPPGVAFAAMILVTAFNGYMAWAQEAELLGLYAIAGALSTPLLVSTGENHELTLFSYLLLLNLASLVLVALRPWSRLLFAAFAGTVFFVAGWWLEYYSEAQFGWTAFFLSCFFLLFAFAPRLIRVDLQDGQPHSAWDNLALVLLPIANAALGFLAYYALFDRFKSDWAGAWLAVGFAAFYLGLLRLPSRGRLQPSSKLLSDLHLTAAVVFLTVAIPLKAQGRWLTTGWLVEGAALLWMAGRLRLPLLRSLALLCLALGLAALLVVNPAASTTPFFNERFAVYCVAIAAFAFAAWVAWQSKPDEEAAAPEDRIWPSIAACSLLAVNLLILLAAGFEIHSYWWLLRWTGDGNLWATYQMYAQFTYSAWFMLFGAILLAVGFWRRSAFLRWQALLLLAATVVKVFLYDMSTLSQGYRILSFLGLGALLLAVSFVYQRDWLNLRAVSEGKDEI
jgi:uncharacterized membrane protein